MAEKNLPAAEAGGCCRRKETPRSEELQVDLQKRLNRVIGQLGGIKTMIDDNRYCGDVLTQLAAAESAMREPPLGKLHAAGTEAIRRRQPEKLPLV